jgi:hypothetical protein
MSKQDFFFNAVAHMRECQKAFFSSRTQENLAAAKMAESVVDKLIREQQTNQTEIFPNGQQ